MKFGSLVVATIFALSCSNNNAEANDNNNLRQHQRRRHLGDGVAMPPKNRNLLRSRSSRELCPLLVVAQRR